MRRARAVASVAGLKEQALLAQRKVKTQWFAWREAMARCLLADKAPNDAEQEAAFFEGFHSGDFDLHQWVRMGSVTPNQAAQFLNGKNPLQAPDDAKAQMLASVFEDAKRLNPANRTLLDWLAVARSRGTDYDGLAAKFVDVNTRVEDTPQAAAPEPATTDFTMLATREQLIAAFGAFTGMAADWFRNLKDTPALLAARRITGQGGRGRLAEPYFCPFTVMQWLVKPKRKKGRKLSEHKGWELLEKHFPMVYTSHSIGDPRDSD